MAKANWKVWFYVGLILFSFWTLYLYFYSPTILGWMVREDTLLEPLSAAFYLLAAAVFFVMWGKLGFKNVFVLGYALLCLFVGGEEISWGQRIIGITTPESLADINVQRESNLHNIDGIHQHIRKVGLLVVLVIAIVLPLSKQLNSRLRKLYSRLSLPVVPLWTVPLTLLAIMFMAVPRILGSDRFFPLDEIGEFYFSITFLLFALNERNSTP